MLVNVTVLCACATATRVRLAFRHDMRFFADDIHAPAIYRAAGRNHPLESMTGAVDRRFHHHITTVGWRVAEYRGFHRGV